MQGETDMKLYTTTGTRSLRQRCNELNVGLMMVNHWRDPEQWPYFAIDNGCYSAYAQGKDWEATQFLSILYKCKRNGLRPDFVVIPDIVAGGIDSLRKSERWAIFLKSEFPSYPLFVAVQDGMTIEDIDQSPVMERIDGLFIGGTMQWKMETLFYWSRFAKENGLRIHTGRIGPLDSMLRCDDAEMDSIDSTSWVQNKGWLETRVAKYREMRN